MDKELPSTPPLQNGLDESSDLSVSITKAISRTRECVKDDILSARVIQLLEDIRILSLLNRHKVNTLMLFATRLWVAAADFSFTSREFFESEIEYVEGEIDLLKDKTKN